MQLDPALVDLGCRLERACGPLGASQLVHADLTQNVLVGPSLPPAVIDVSPYWRPPAYAEGVVVADALCWHGASASLVEAAGVPVSAVARALLFRIATTSVAVDRGRAVDLDDEVSRYALAVSLLGL